MIEHMDVEKIEVIRDSFLSDDEWQKYLLKRANEIEASGYRIVSAEPIERIFVHVIGRRFGVEKV